MAWFTILTKIAPQMDQYFKIKYNFYVFLRSEE
jgi:hypothetical protein